MNLYKTEGLILKSLCFKEHDLILTVFTKEEGVIPLLFKGGQSAKRKNGAGSYPFTHAEFVCRRGVSELIACREISVLNYHLSLRKDLLTLQSAGEIVHAITRSQLQSKPAPDLYTLTLRYLSALPEARDPEIFPASFYLKLLWHEGLFSDPAFCVKCGQALMELRVMQGECLCCAHAPSDANIFSEQEASFIRTSLFSRSIEILKSETMPDRLFHKIKDTFTSIISC